MPATDFLQYEDTPAKPAGSQFLEYQDEGSFPTLQWATKEKPVDIAKYPVLKGGQIYTGSAENDDIRISWLETPTDLESRKEYFNNLPERGLEKVEDTSWLKLRDLAQEKGEYQAAWAETIGSYKRGQVPNADVVQRETLQRLVDKDVFYKNYLDHYRLLGLHKYVEDNHFQLDPSEEGWQIDYTQSLNGWKGRFVVSSSDTTLDKLRIVEELTGRPGKVDLGGRVLFQPEANKWAPVDGPEFDIWDILADPLEDIPEVVAEVGATYWAPGPLKEWGATHLSSRVLMGILRAGAIEAPAGAGTELLWELGERATGLDSEETAVLLERAQNTWATNAALGSLVPIGVGFVNGVRNNPLYAFVTPESKAVVDSVNRLIARGQARDPSEVAQVMQGLERFKNLNPDEQAVLLSNPEKLNKDFGLRPSQVNASAALRRLDSFLSQIPGAAGVYEALTLQQKQFLEQEVFWMLKDVPERLDAAPVIQRQLEHALRANIRQRKSIMGLMVDEMSYRDAGTIVYDAVDRFKNTFVNEAEKKAVALDDLLRPILTKDDWKYRRVISAKPLVQLYNSMYKNPAINKEIVDAVSGNEYLTKRLQGVVKRLQGETAQGVILDPKTMRPIEISNKVPHNLTMEEYRLIQRDLSDIINEAPTLRKTIAQLSESLNPTKEGSEAIKHTRTRMKELGYDEATIDKYLSEFKSFNAWYADTRALFDASAEGDKYSVFGKILDNWRRGETGGMSGGAEKIVHMLIPSGGDISKSGISNLKYAELFKEWAKPEELQAVQEALITRLVGNGNDRNVNQLAAFMRQSDTHRDLYTTILGAETVAQLDNFGKYLSGVTAGDAWKIANDLNIKAGQNEIIAGLVKRGKIATGGDFTAFSDVVTQLSQAGKMEEVEAVKGFFLEEILKGARRTNTSEPFPHLDGDALLHSLQEYGQENISRVLGEDVAQTLNDLALASRVGGKETSGAGSLAAGVMVANTFLRGEVWGGLVQATKSSILARLMLSKPIRSWLGRPDLALSTKQGVRNASAAMVYIHNYLEDIERGGMVDLKTQEDLDRYYEQKWDEAMEYVTRQERDTLWRNRPKTERTVKPYRTRGVQAYLKSLEGK